MHAWKMQCPTAGEVARTGVLLFLLRARRRCARACLALLGVSVPALSGSRLNMPSGTHA